MAMTVDSPREGAVTTLTEHPLMLSVNGQHVQVRVMADTSLLLVLRNDLALNGPKFGCGLGECGACTVLIDGLAARACVIPARGVTQRAITTLEGLGNRDCLHPVQRAFIEQQAAQCGYCLNGMIMTTKALLDRNPSPSDAEIRRALSGNLCRCGTHIEILNAVKRAIELCGGEARDD
ncbi:TPA: (2Fe-2S)-binding protein [Serratia odorifera]|jgi:nicotinate dehydrogenase subunit A|uniref:(2Fe-2S)-binding protein n=1 Tax=Serratia odorifera TaxID=618 RepID=UPI0018E7D011|nr:(2Fe-2S)-binding protein [Serratia odorifera]MBJ2064956.1 (2Fe-2S)-binding protein [Serratia odorifera]HEJ9093612.1 (2Fe-2S)-binding protein [Serratia odorifera]HEJ9098136.1 (2Fe-2S)-binding protein [Serratia odorifera]